MSNTIGARFHMDSVDYYINSSATDVRQNNLKYRYLLDEQNYRVGKIFVDKKIIVFDDQEIVAALDYKSNRRYTLPIPKIGLVPTDTKCGINSDITPLLSGTTETVFISYILTVVDEGQQIIPALSGMNLNYYPTITGSSIISDVSIKFGNNDFKFMQSTLNGYVNGYIANKLYVLVQKVDTGDQPSPDGWKLIDMTSDIPNHTVGDYIKPGSMRGARFIISGDDYASGVPYDIESFLGELPDEPPITPTTPEFGDQQPFPGSVKLTRATDLEVMRFLVNLPDGTFETTQNPTYVSGDKRVTEITLLDENKDVLVIGKTPRPIVRTGTQVFAVKIDL